MIICFNKKINNFNKNNFKKINSHKEQTSYIQSLMPNITDISDNDTSKELTCKSEYRIFFSTGSNCVHITFT